MPEHDDKNPEAAGEPAATDDRPEPAATDDRFRPDAIAARVEGMGEESELDRVARQEEQKLLERRRQGGKGKRGLEAAASKRLAKIGEGTVKRPTAASMGYVPEADPLIERARRAGTWIERHRATFGAMVGLAAIGLGGAIAWSWHQSRREAQASATLAIGFADEHGHVSDPGTDDEDEQTSAPLYPTFKSAADRRAAALAKYREVESKYPGTGAAILARLAEAGLLLDAGDGHGAKAAYEDVKGSALARADGEVRGRALEGIGFADEMLAQREPDKRDKHLDDALTAFKALENVGVDGFKELGGYHRARVLRDKGDKAQAVEILKQVYKEVAEPGESHSFSYLQFVVEDRLRELDPSALPPKPAPGAGRAGGKVDANDPKIQQLLRQLQQQAQQKGGAPAPVAPNGSK